MDDIICLSSDSSSEDDENFREKSASDKEIKRPSFFELYKDSLRGTSSSLVIVNNSQKQKYKTVDSVKSQSSCLKPQASSDLQTGNQNNHPWCQSPCTKATTDVLSKVDGKVITCPSSPVSPIFTSTAYRKRSAIDLNRPETSNFNKSSSNVSRFSIHDAKTNSCHETETSALQAYQYVSSRDVPSRDVPDADEVGWVTESCKSVLQPHIVDPAYLVNSSASKRTKLSLKKTSLEKTLKSTNDDQESTASTSRKLNFSVNCSDQEAGNTISAVLDGDACSTYDEACAFIASADLPQNEEAPRICEQLACSEQIECSNTVPNNYKMKGLASLADGGETLRFGVTLMCESPSQTYCDDSDESHYDDCFVSLDKLCASDLPDSILLKHADVLTLFGQSVSELSCAQSDSTYSSTGQVRITPLASQSGSSYMELGSDDDLFDDDFVEASCMEETAANLPCCAIQMNQTLSKTSPLQHDDISQVITNDTTLSATVDVNSCESSNRPIEDIVTHSTPDDIGDARRLSRTKVKSDSSIIDNFHINTAEVDAVESLNPIAEKEPSVAGENVKPLDIVSPHLFYSQADDDCTIIGDSDDDELFANLTQRVIEATDDDDMFIVDEEKPDWTTKCEHVLLDILDKEMVEGCTVDSETEEKVLDDIIAPAASRVASICSSSSDAVSGRSDVEADEMWEDDFDEDYMNDLDDLYSSVMNAAEVRHADEKLQQTTTSSTVAIMDNDADSDVVGSASCHSVTEEVAGGVGSNSETTSSTDMQQHGSIQQTAISNQASEVSCSGQVREFHESESVPSIVGQSVRAADVQSFPSIKLNEQSVTENNVPCKEKSESVAAATTSMKQLSVVVTRLSSKDITKGTKSNTSAAYINESDPVIKSVQKGAGENEDIDKFERVAGEARPKTVPFKVTSSEVLCQNHTTSGKALESDAESDAVKLASRDSITKQRSLKRPHEQTTGHNFEARRFYGDHHGEPLKKSQKQGIQTDIAQSSWDKFSNVTVTKKLIQLVNIDPRKLRKDGPARVSKIHRNPLISDDPFEMSQVSRAKKQLRDRQSSARAAPVRRAYHSRPTDTFHVEGEADVAKPVAAVPLSESGDGEIHKQPSDDAPKNVPCASSELFVVPMAKDKTKFGTRSNINSRVPKRTVEDKGDATVAEAVLRSGLNVRTSEKIPGRFDPSKEIPVAADKDHIASRNAQFIGQTLEKVESAKKYDKVLPVKAAQLDNHKDLDLEMKLPKISSRVVAVDPKSSGVFTLDSLIASAVQNRDTSAVLESTSLVVSEKMPIQKPAKIRIEDIVMPYADLPIAKTDSPPNVSTDTFLFAVLGWSPKWLPEYAKHVSEADSRQREPPPVIKNIDNVYPLLETYNSFEDYVNIIQPLLMLDVWESGRSTKSKIAAYSADFKKGDGWSSLLLTCHCASSAQDSELREGDLVVVHLRPPPLPAVENGQKAAAGTGPSKNRQLLTPVVKPVFGYVCHSQKYGNRQSEKLHQLVAEKLKTNRRLVVRKYVIQLNHRKYPIDNTNFLDVERVSSLLSSYRQFQALLCLPRSRLARDILRPCNRHVFFHNHCALNIKKEMSLNASQYEAVARITHAISQPYVSPKICLLQGPPGTGKSYTIIALVESILAEKRNGETLKILLCAPSNAGIDELCRRLRDRNSMAEKAKGKKIEFVRVGQINSIHMDVKPFSIQEIVKHKHKTMQDSHLKSVNQAVVELTKKISALEKNRESCVNQIETNRIDGELKKLKKRKASCTPSQTVLTGSEEHKLKRKVIQAADVVCTTLNHSGSTLLWDILKPSNEDGKRTVNFGCVIVDEASQCTELDCLIPLQYSATKMVLVGDPEQLPPTVISQKAADKNYGQSLFERLYGCFSLAPVSPVLMLKTQYRMHADICRFPNNYVYGGRLETDRGIQLKRESFPFNPYTVFDLQDSFEEVDSSSSSVCNPNEAIAVRWLCQQLSSYMKPKNRLNSIGIITPYQRQRTLLMDQLKACNLNEIEIGTVDGFQGREKDVIILSCVRANRANSIGFLGDRRRLNVSLTRARYSMFVVGNMATLQTVHADESTLVCSALQVHPSRTNEIDFNEQAIELALVATALHQVDRKKQPRKRLYYLKRKEDGIRKQANSDWSALYKDARERHRIIELPSMKSAERCIRDGCYKPSRG